MSKKLIYLIGGALTAAAIFIGGYYLGGYFKECPVNNCTEETEKKDDKTKSTSSYTYVQVDLNKLKVAKDSSDTNATTDKIEIVKVLQGAEQTVYEDYSDPSSAKKIYSGLVVVGKNNNDVTVDITFIFDFLDNNNRVIDYVYGNADSVKPGETFIVNISTMTKSDFSGYRLSYKTSHNKTYHTEANVSIDDFEVYEVDESFSKSIKTKFTNSSDKDVHISFGIIYYKNGEIIFADTSEFYDAKPDSIKEHSFSSYRLGSRTYDRYKLVVFGAYVYETEWK